MQAIMLAAGMGKRLGKYTKGNTKCMVEVASRTILSRAADALAAAGIQKLIVVCGYERESLKAYTRENIKNIEVIFIDNPDYNTTNNIYSLSLASDYLMADDTILLESDLVFEESIIQKLLECPYENAAVVAKYEQWMDGTVTVTDEGDNIVEFIEKKDFCFDKTESYYKTVNIYKFSKEFCTRYYIPFLEAYIKAYGMNEYYELVLKALAHLSRTGLKAFKLTDEKWYEIDDAQDLDIANTLFANGDSLTRYNARFGGYWRFSKLLDFCYLVNPYFPPVNMMDKLKYMFSELLTAYPSTMYVQSINAGRMFLVDEEYILVGNGAAELISAVGSLLSGKTVALTIPTFNEYKRCFKDCAFELISSAQDNFCLNVDKIIAAADTADAAVVVSPDNPTGHMLSFDDILRIVEHYDSLGKYLILDESFADFAEEKLRHTWLNNELLTKYKKLIVVKSISKSYGIPGLRLGVLATGDPQLRETLLDRMPVWNINSFAEYFLQIITLYQKDYTAACEKIVAERNRFFTLLREIPGIIPYPSQANYILCALEGNFSASSLAEYLLSKNIYIKVLTGKEGFGNKEFIRLAVRNDQDNDSLIRALHEFIQTFQKGSAL